MDARRPGRTGWLLAVTLLGLAGAVRGESLPAGRLLPLAVRAGQCRFVLPAADAGDQFLLVLGSLAHSAGPYRVRIQTEATTDPVSLPADTLPVLAWTPPERHDVRREPERPPPGSPPRQRVFHLHVGGRDWRDPAGYVAVTGLLAALGRHTQVYVDRDESDLARVRPAAEEVVRTFDETVHPLTGRWLGQCVDVDGDGRFTVLFSRWLGRLGDGTVALGGCVREADFRPDLATPFGNRCDLMYLHPALTPGPHLRTLLAHEYAHAVVCSAHLKAGGRPEEAWLDEGLAHLAEDLHGFGWSNLDHRVSAFLSDPAHYQLVVPEYHHGGPGRAHGHRGAAYLFLRWCLDRHGPGLPARLVHSGLTGTLNVEAATGEPFPALFRRWSVALAVDRPDLCRPLGARLLAGPRLLPLPLDGGGREVTLAGTACAHLLLHSPGRPRSRVTVSAEAGADLQVSLFRLPPGTPRLDLRREPAPEGAYRLRLTAQDAAVTLEAAAWERLLPSANRAGDTSFNPTAAGERVRAWFGRSHLDAGASAVSVPIPLPAGGPFVFKVLGRDAAGRAVTAWLTTE